MRNTHLYMSLFGTCSNVCCDRLSIIAPCRRNDNFSQCTTLVVLVKLFFYIVQQRVAPTSESFGLIKWVLGNIEIIGKTSNKTSKSWGQARTKLYLALEASSDPCPLWGDKVSYKCHFEMNLEIAPEMMKYNTRHTHGWLICTIESPSPACDYHTFFAFWLWPSVAVTCF